MRRGLDSRTERLDAHRGGSARATTLETAVAPHFDHVARSYRLTEWARRRDVPAWMRARALVTTLHGMHYTGFMFNDYAKHARDPALDGDADSGRPRARVSRLVGRPLLLGLPATTKPPVGMGGEAGFTPLVAGGQDWASG